MHAMERLLSWPLGREGDPFRGMFSDGAANWWMVCLTALAVVGAFLAFNEARRTREDSLRPLPFIAKCLFWAEGERGFKSVHLEIYIGNAGPGPALDVYVRSWLVVSANDTATAIKVHLASQAALAEVAGVKPHFQGMIGLMPASSDPKKHVLRAQEHFLHDPFLQGSPKAIFVTQITFCDVYNRRFWEPGRGEFSTMEAAVGRPS